MKSYLKFVLFIFIGLIPIIAGSATIEEINEKRVKVAMRMIGHEFLTKLGDTISRVMPIEKNGNEYKIPFESDFGFEAEDIISVIDSNMTKSGITTDYLAEVINCNSEDVVHSYTVGNAVNPNMTPCQGRVYPEDCYYILITILDSSKLDSGESGALEMDSTGIRSNNLFISGFLILPILFLLGLISYYKRKKKAVSVDPNLLVIGATQFDKRNMTLSYNNQSVDLSSKEAELLSVLHDASNETIERNEILKKVWGDEGDYIGRTLDVFISKLRKKLAGDESLRIVNARGIGYKLVVDDPA